MPSLANISAPRRNSFHKPRQFSCLPPSFLAVTYGNSNYRLSMKDTRRQFLKTTVLATSAVSIVPWHVLGGPGRRAPGDKLNIAGIGVGGMGQTNLKACSGENIVALCDVDSNYAAKTFAEYPKARIHRDFRRMLEDQKDIEAVIIATPDHSHAPVAMAAMRAGKHVYVQKPMTYSVHEARVLTEAARQYKVASQMGNQGHSGDGTRLVCEWIRGRGHRPGAGSPRLDQPPGLAAGHRGRAPQGDARRSGGAGLGPLARPGPLPALSPGLCARHLAGLVRFWHRLTGRPGLPSAGRAVLGAQAQVPGERRGLHFDLLARTVEKDRTAQ